MHGKRRIYGEFYFSFVSGFLVPVPVSGCGIWGSRYTGIPVTYMTVDQQPSAVTVDTRLFIVSFTLHLINFFQVNLSEQSS
jgi:hypothetical protein